MLTGGVMALLAGVGLLRFSTPYARFHAAGKASPIGFLIAALGASLTFGPAGAGLLLVAAAAMTLTLPVGVHLLFRATYRAGDNGHLTTDHLATDELPDTDELADTGQLPDSG